jgi:hypothetical protein
MFSKSNRIKKYARTLIHEHAHALCIHKNTCTYDDIIKILIQSSSITMIKICQSFISQPVSTNIKTSSSLQQPLPSNRREGWRSHRSPLTLWSYTDLHCKHTFVESCIHPKAPRLICRDNSLKLKMNKKYSVSPNFIYWSNKPINCPYKFWPTLLFPRLFSTENCWSDFLFGLLFLFVGLMDLIISRISTLTKVGFKY